MLLSSNDTVDHSKIPYGPFLRDAWGRFSAAAISAIKVKLDEGLAEFARRRLDEACPHLIMDARYERVREAGVIRSQAVLLAIASTRTAVAVRSRPKVDDDECFARAPVALRPTRPRGGQARSRGLTRQVADHLS